MKTEPLVSVAVLTSIIGAVLALLHSFGVPLTNEQQAAISGLALVLAPLVVALVVRPKVTPVAPANDAGAVSVITVVAVLVGICAVIYILGHVHFG